MRSSAEKRDTCMMSWYVCAEKKKDMYPLLFDADSIPGVDFSIWGSREGDLENQNWLTMSSNSRILFRFFFCFGFFNF